MKPSCLILLLFISVTSIRAQSFYTPSASVGSSINSNSYFTGSLGIGTNTPATRFHLTSAGSTVATIESSGSGTRTAEIAFRDNGTVKAYVWLAPVVNLLSIGLGNNEHINMRLDNKYVGIGVTNPLGKLHVIGSAYFGNQNEDAPRIALGGSGGDYGSVGYGYLYSTTTSAHTYSVNDQASQLRFDQGGFTFFTAPIGTPGQSVPFSRAMTIKQNGNVGIGTSSPAYKLSVNGKIQAEEIEVVVDVPSDFVFNSDYDLMPLNEVEKYVNENKHLPNVPSANTIIQEGWQVGEMSNKLLEKVEELTLYVIELKKENERLNERLKKVENK